MMCHSMPRTATYGSMASSTGRAAMLCLVPSGLAEAREPAPAVGADARIVLYLCLDVHAPAVRSPLIWFQEVEPPRDDRCHVMSPPSLRLARFSMRQGFITGHFL